MTDIYHNNIDDDRQSLRLVAITSMSLPQFILHDLKVFNDYKLCYIVKKEFQIVHNELLF